MTRDIRCVCSIDFSRWASICCCSLASMRYARRQYAWFFSLQSTLKSRFLMRWPRSGRSSSVLTKRSTLSRPPGRWNRCVCATPRRELHVLDRAFRLVKEAHQSSEMDDFWVLGHMGSGSGQCPQRLAQTFSSTTAGRDSSGNGRLLGAVAARLELRCCTLE